VLHNTQNYRIPYSHYSTAQKANKHNKLTQTPTKHRKPTRSATTASSNGARQPPKLKGNEKETLRTHSPKLELNKTWKV
jgi:hypothetical protein